MTNQRSLLFDFAKKHKLDVCDVYIDDGYSGTIFDRPDFNHMIENIEKKQPMHDLRLLRVSTATHPFPLRGHVATSGLTQITNLFSPMAGGIIHIIGAADSFASQRRDAWWQYDGTSIIGVGTISRNVTMELTRRPRCRLELSAEMSKSSSLSSCRHVSSHYPFAALAHTAACLYVLSSRGYSATSVFTQHLIHSAQWQGAALSRFAS